jgi:hypothetical protein
MRQTWKRCFANPSHVIWVDAFLTGFNRFVRIHKQQSVFRCDAISHSGNIWKARCFAALPYVRFDGTDVSRQHGLRKRACVEKDWKSEVRPKHTRKKPSPSVVNKRARMLTRS